MSASSPALVSKPMLGAAGGIAMVTPSSHGKKVGDDFNMPALARQGGEEPAPHPELVEGRGASCFDRLSMRPKCSPQSFGSAADFMSSQGEPSASASGGP